MESYFYLIFIKDSADWQAQKVDAKDGRKQEPAGALFFPDP